MNNSTHTMLDAGSKRNFDVFLSHKSAHKPWIEWLAHALVAQGFPVFLDKWHLVPGQSWVQGLHDGLEQCRAAVLVATPDVVRSGWVREEYNSLISRRQSEPAFHLVPLVFGETPDLPFLRNLHSIDCSDPIRYRDWFHAVVCGLKGSAPGARPIEYLGLDAPPAMGEVAKSIPGDGESARAESHAVQRPRVDRMQRWPTGCLDFQQEVERTRVDFHAYLRSSSKLTYVPISPERAPERLLSDLDHRTQHSTVLHGRGGAGKSRLMWEIGHAAVADGWFVLLVAGDRTSPDTLPEILRLTGYTKVLLLMDYVERCDSWDTWLWALQDACDQGAHVHLLGTCRTRWTQTIDPYQTHLEALPEELPDTVMGVLRQRPGLDDLAGACRGIPVFAAFLCMLHDKAQMQELAALRREQDFSRWLQEHLVRLPRNAAPSAHAALVELLLNLPCSATELQSLEASSAAIQPYREQLLADGWLMDDIAAPENERWSTLHDVLADGALLRWLDSTNPNVAQSQMQRWLISADQRGTLRVILRSLQRVAQEPSIRDLNWQLIFSGPPELKERWQSVRDAILLTQLMPPLAAFLWLDGMPELPDQALSSIAVHKILADAVEEWRLTPCHPHSESQTTTEYRLLYWLDVAANTLTGRGFPITSAMPNRVLVQGLRWKPDRYRVACRDWLESHHRQEQAQFMLNTWLRLHQQVDDSIIFAKWVSSWAYFHGRRPVASFVYRSWLDAGGEKSLVETAIAQWLAEPSNANSLEASFVFKAWLDAGGGKSLVRSAISRWLAEPNRATSPKARFVFKAWLDASGDKPLVETAIAQWLAEPGQATSPEASFVFRAWLDSGGGKSLVEIAIGKWLAESGRAISPEAPFLFKAWLDADGDMSLLQTAIQRWFELPENMVSKGAGFLITALGDRNRNLPDWVSQPASAWIIRWWEHEDAGHALKYIAGIPSLSMDAFRAATAWCLKHPDNPDSIFRLTRLNPKKLNFIESRAEFIKNTSSLIERSIRQAPDNIYYSGACLHALASVWGLPVRTTDEKHATRYFLRVACYTLRIIGYTKIPSFEKANIRWVEHITKTDWEHLIQLGVVNGEQWDQELRNGITVFAQHCRRWGPSEQALTMYDRLLEHAKLSFPPSFPQPI